MRNSPEPAVRRTNAPCLARIAFMPDSKFSVSVGGRLVNPRKRFIANHSISMHRQHLKSMGLEPTDALGESARQARIVYDSAPPILP